MNSPEIAGNTRVILQLAHPSAHVRAPQAFNRHFAKHGIPAVMLSADVPPADLNAMLTGVRGWRNLAGLGITMPHKVSAARLLDRLHPTAELVGAVNTVKREPDGTLVGAMFDGVGFVDGLRAAGHHPSGRRSLLIGAGGAGRAIAFALAEAGVTDLTIANRTPATAEKLAREVNAAHPTCTAAGGTAEGHGYELVVNATSLGMRTGDPLPLDPATMSPGTVVAEVVMRPDVTPLLLAAEERDCTAHRGRHMIDAQIRRVCAFLDLQTGTDVAADERRTITSSDEEHRP
jgi:shikimate dehydrogenase